MASSGRCVQDPLFGTGADGAAAGLTGLAGGNGLRVQMVAGTIDIVLHHTTLL